MAITDDDGGVRLDRREYERLRRLLASDDAGVAWEPMTNGDPTTPELVFSPTGDVLMVEMP